MSSVYLMSFSEQLSQLLNSEQYAAVENLNGPTLILAGAGSGKTRVLTYRVANLIAQGEASPEEILAVTFTNKAASEMEARIQKLLAEMDFFVNDRLWVSTFHSTCVRILRDHADLLGYQKFFGIYDSSDQLSMVKKVLTALNINEKVFPAKNFQSQINSAKSEGFNVDRARKRGSLLMDEQAFQVYEFYEKEMYKANCMDFGDLLLKTYDIFEMYPDILNSYQDKFRYLFVDEYQDTNHIQYNLINLLAAKNKNLCVVGDEDQSIYSWRGADISNILNFEKDYPDAKVFKLEQNYRSTGNIVRAASEVIRNNSQRKEKVLFTDNDPGQKITVREETNEYDEARFIVRQIESWMTSDPAKTYQDFAMFYRTNAQSRVLEEQLRSNQIPYKMIGGMRFYERMEIKDMLAYLKMIVNPTDDVAAKRIINVPARGIGKTTIEKIEAQAISSGSTFLDAVLFCAENRMVHAGACKKLQAFYNLMEKLKAYDEIHSPSETYQEALAQVGYTHKLKEENTPESQSRIENLEELNNAIVQFEQERGEEGTLVAFLEEMSLVSDADQLKDEENSVTMMTLHVSKGLEYPVVFLTGMEEGLFPSGRSFDSVDPDKLEEERRLAYVGMTRAEEKLYLTHARTRRVWGNEQNHPPSRFIDELPDEYIERATSSRRPSSSFMERNRYSGAKSSARKKSNDPFPDYDNADSFQGETINAIGKGTRVRHPTFGVGSVLKVEGSGDLQKISVVFADKSLKKFVAKYARLERV